MKTTAPTELLEAARKGETTAQREIGLRFLHGTGVIKNVVEAEKWLQLASEANDAWSQYCLGSILYSQERLSEAEQWWQRAASAGNPQAMCGLGNIAHKRKNITDAEKWWLKAAEQGEPRAQRSLGFFCSDSLGPVESLKWTMIAANNGNTEAQKYLGFLYVWGYASLQRNKILALKWMTLGSEDRPFPFKHSISPFVARLFCSLIKLFMSRSEINEAHRMIQEWRSNAHRA